MPYGFISYQLSVKVTFYLVSSIMLSAIHLNFVTGIIIFSFSTNLPGKNFSNYLLLSLPSPSLSSSSSSSLK